MWFVNFVSFISILSCRVSGTNENKDNDDRTLHLLGWKSNQGKMFQYKDCVEAPTDKIEKKICVIKCLNCAVVGLVSLFNV